VAGIAGVLDFLREINRVHGGSSRPVNWGSATSSLTIVNQMPSTAWWFALACFGLAVFLRPPVVLPLSVIGVSIANAANVAVPPLSAAIDPGLGSQFTQSLAAPDSWLFRLPVNMVAWGCLGSFIAGIMVCGFINRILA
jgi:hypothetical protein